ncbi:peroxidase 24-like [Coffea eugenioides]|uniref:peroxidase 24-like n=1 Tax=Coffea eugenioides TaxID=49369 RepID=UPI000F60AF36|nr:peroxidase 24-like [Coffea eugenioides]
MSMVLFIVIRLDKNYNKPIWEVLTGRRDGGTSHASEALANIPSPFSNFTTLMQSFASKNLTVHDLVILSGAHTIGVGHCNMFRKRLYNFTGKVDADPSLNSTYAAFLRTKCESLSDNTTTVEMDPGISVASDNHYFSNLKHQQGLFQSDAALLTDRGASNIVDEMLTAGKFFTEFGQSMKRMGAIGVLTGNAGEIRKKCSGIVLFLEEQYNYQGELQRNYYRKSCRGVEQIVRDITWRNVSANPSLAPKLLRLHYHDCFVRGCDGSVLLDSTPNNPSEKEAIPNRSLSGFDFIDIVKSILEEECPGAVSCADILALAARDAVSYQFQRPMWQVFTGRQDGRVSVDSEALAGLPSPSSDFPTLLQNFQSNNLDVVDLVTLSGAHTIGVTHCNLVAKRLYNFTGKGDTDPSLDSEYAQTLKTICPLPIVRTTTLGMDPGSSDSFDNHYFVALSQNMTVFQSDSALLSNPLSATIASHLQNPRLFFALFARSMTKMGAIGVLTNGEGEIRQNCRVVNA